MNKSTLIALTMTAAIILWMASGLISTPEKNISPAATAKNEQLMLVETQWQAAKTVQLTLTVQGYVEPKRTVKIRSDVAGYVSQVLIKEGEWVENNTVLLRLAPEDKLIKLDKEKALLLSKEQSYARAKKLSEENLQSKSALEEAYAALKSAQANLAQIEFEIEKLAIKAPFDGILNMRLVEEGSYISANSDIAQFVDNNTLTVVIPVAQQNIQQLRLGGQAQVSFATGEVKQGVINHISVLANENTRTFSVEIIVENNDRKIPAGISAEINVPLAEVIGHFISPAILGLDNNGQMGVKTVGENNIVIFHTITIIQANSQGIWVSGLPENAQIITVGQGFVEAGNKVETQQQPTTSVKASL